MSTIGHNWVAALDQALPLFGHRNWVIVADSAYPAQTAAGVQIVTTDADELAVLSGVLNRIENAHHVRPLIHLDSELLVMTDADSPGVEEYRRHLIGLLAGKSLTKAPHEQLLKQLNAAGQTYQILVIKTGMTIPYTSVFIELDCGYWSAEAEAKLRERMSQ